MDAGILHREIAKVCPVSAVTVGVADDRDTWTFIYKPEATQEQIDAGLNVLETIPVDYEPPPLEDVALYDHENRIRTLEGQPKLSLTDYIAKKAKMR